MIRIDGTTGALRLAVGACAVAAIAGYAAPAAAQSSISTFGTTDARECFSRALDNISTTVSYCDEALRDGNLTVRDARATRVNRGIILTRAERYDDALADFNAVLEDDSASAEALLNRGNVYVRTSRFSEALDDYRASLDAGLRKAHLAWYNIGLAHEGLKQKDEALAAYRASLDLAPDFALARRKVDALSRSGQEAGE